MTCLQRLHRLSAPSRASETSGVPVVALSREEKHGVVLYVGRDRGKMLSGPLDQFVKRRLLRYEHNAPMLVARGPPLGV